MDYKFMNDPYNFCIAETSGRNTAVFGQATYRLFDQRLGFTAGIRFEEAERSMDRNDDAIFNYSDSKTENEWLPRFIVDYKFTKDLMTYASVSKGWRNGGLNPYAPTRDLIEYDKETAWNYELGFKSSFLENRLRLNAALFYMDVEGYQETIYSNMTSYFGNAEAVTLKGFELELEARPWEGWLFIASFGYTDAVYDEYQMSETVSLNDNTVADTPEYEFSAVAQYTFPFGLYMRGEFFANGDNYLTPENDYKQDSYQLYNARIGYQGEDFEVYLFGENLSDEFYFIDASTLLDGLGYGPAGMGRTIGAGVSYYF
jgi:iron complex outermembrane receptor protein